MLVPAAQACLQVGHVHPLVVAGKGTHEGGGGIALHEDQVRPGALEHTLEAGDDPGGDIEQALPAGHDVQVILRLDAEEAGHLVKHLPVLAGDTDLDVEVGGPAPKLKDQGSHLDGFRTGTEDEEDLGNHGSTLSTVQRKPRIRDRPLSGLPIFALPSVVAILILVTAVVLALAVVPGGVRADIVEHAAEQLAFHFEDLA